MKTLYIVRHAKSNRDIPGLLDFERPLNERGRSDAPKMGKWMLAKGHVPDAIMSSPANRALTTARLMAEFMNLPINLIKVDHDIYEAWTEKLVEVLKRTENDPEKLMLVGHNPGLLLLAGYLAGIVETHLPTNGIICLKLEVDHWKDVFEKCGKLIFFESPKKLK